MRLFVHYLENLQWDTIWIDKDLLTSEKELMSNLMSEGALFDCFDINKMSIKYIPKYQWRIENDDYKEFICKKPRQYIKSPTFEWIENNIKFHFRCCPKTSDISSNCSFYLCLNALPQGVKSIDVEMDVVCDKNIRYGHLMTTQKLTKSELYCGFQTFPFEELQKDISITWNIAMKMHIHTKNAYSDKYPPIPKWSDLMQATERIPPIMVPWVSRIGFIMSDEESKTDEDYVSDIDHELERKCSKYSISVNGTPVGDDGDIDNNKDLATVE